MLSPTIIPEHHHISLPAMPIMIFMPLGFRIEHIEYERALGRVHVLNPESELWIDENRLAPCHWMNADYRVSHLGIHVFIVAKLRLALCGFVKEHPKGFEVMNRFEPRQEVLPAIGESIPDRTHRCKRGVTTHFWDNF